MAISSMDGLVAALCSTTLHQRKGFIKNQSSFTQGYWHSLWGEAGVPAAGATPRAFSATNGGEVVDSSTTGALQGLAAVTGGNTQYIARASLEAVFAYGWILYDRLWQCASFVGNSTSLQSVNGTPPALTRPDSTGAGTELWLEFPSAAGATSTTITVTYTNSAGTGSRTATCVMPTGGVDTYCAIQFKLQAGDLGVRSVQSLQLTPSTGSAGNLGLVILRRLATVSMQQAGCTYEADFIAGSMPAIDSGACLALMTLGGNVTPGLVSGLISVIEG